MRGKLKYRATLTIAARKCFRPRANAVNPGAAALSRRASGLAERGSSRSRLGGLRSSELCGCCRYLLNLSFSPVPLTRPLVYLEM
jgi:hypothetical protein